MLSSTIRRLALSVPTVLIVVAITVLLVELMPGNPAEIIAGEFANEAAVEATRERLQLEASPLSRFISYVSDAVRGDLGDSFYTRRPVTTSIAEALPATASIAGVALLFGCLLGVSSGVLAAVRRGRLSDRAVGAISAAGLSIPPFVWAFVLLIAFAVQRSWLPATGYVPLSESFSGWARHIVLPGLALGFAVAAELARQTRSAMAAVLEEDYIRTARAAGLPSRAVIGKRALRNAAIPVVTVVGLQAARVLSGVIIVEAVFAVPGFGTLAFQAVLGRDLPLIQGVVLVSALIIVAINLLVDLSYAVLNPRLRELR